MMPAIAHLTSAHPRDDTRIFYKMCISVVRHGYQAILVVADGHGPEERNGVKIVDVGVFRRRLDRILHAPGHVLRKALEIDADLYQLHDPELLPVGLKLKHMGKAVVFDFHEDVPKQMLGKPYLNKPLLWLISRFLQFYEGRVCKKFDGIVTATPFIRDKFLRINAETVDINNYPLLNELTTESSWDNKRLEVCYIGSIGRIRGIEDLCAAMGQLKTGARLNLCGKFSEPEAEKAVKSRPEWQRVNEYGIVDRTVVREVLARSMAGLVTLHPVINYLDALPVKMFEYMSASLPVIASDFPLWREIIEKYQCGLLVDPLEPRAIARAIDHLVTHPAEARQMGENGRKAVMERYNWQNEEGKLIGFYKRLMQGKR